VPSQMALCATRKTSKVDSNGGLSFFTMPVVLAGIYVGFNIGSPPRRSPGAAQRKGPGLLPDPGRDVVRRPGPRTGAEWKPQPCTHTQNAVAVVVFPGRCRCTMVGAGQPAADRNSVESVHYVDGRRRDLRAALSRQRGRGCLGSTLCVYSPIGEGLPEEFRP
jgi:hypothetical protein